MRRLAMVPVFALGAMALIAGCHVQQAAPAVAAQPLPPIPVYQISSPTDSAGVTIAPVTSRDPLAQVMSTKRITLTADNADARTLLLWLARQAETSIAISPDVQARVSVSFRDVPVVDAMRAILAEAGLSVLVGPLKSPWPPVVFYQLPVNINMASAEAIATRFGVSLELAKFIVENRPPER